MSNKPVDLRAYLARLQLAGLAEPNLKFLDLLHQRHTLSVPFENIDIFNGIPIHLDTEAILEKVVTARRGGFCYELNGAFHWLLEQLGFDVQFLNARTLDEAGELRADYDHMALKVTLDRDYLVDVGSGRGICRPLPMVHEVESRQATGVFRLMKTADGWQLEGYERKNLRFFGLYQVGLEARKLAEFAPMCEFYQSGADSFFKERIICTAAMPDGRITLESDGVVMTRNGVQTKEPFVGDEGLKNALRRYFGVTLPAPISPE